MSQPAKEPDFEAALKRLEAIVQDLEEGELPLEQALKKYEEGVRMADLCSKKLTEAQRRVEVLLKTAGGRMKAEPLEAGEPSDKPRKKK